MDYTNTRICSNTGWVIIILGWSLRGRELPFFKRSSSSKWVLKKKNHEKLGRAISLILFQKVGWVFFLHQFAFVNAAEKKRWKPTIQSICHISYFTGTSISFTMLYKYFIYCCICTHNQVSPHTQSLRPCILPLQSHNSLSDACTLLVTCLFIPWKL